MMSDIFGKRLCNVRINMLHCSKNSFPIIQEALKARTLNVLFQSRRCPTDTVNSSMLFCFHVMCTSNPFSFRGSHRHNAWMIAAVLYMHWSLHINSMWFSLICANLRKSVRTKSEADNKTNLLQNATFLYNLLHVFFFKDWFIVLRCTNVYMNFPLKLFQIPVYMRLLT